MPKNVMKVYGVPGNTSYGWGSLDTGEYLRKLQGVKGIQVYDEMRRSDPQVKSVLRAIELPIRRARYFVEPFSDKPRDKEIADEIWKNLSEGMTITWDDTIRHSLLMNPFGFSILEKVWEYKDGKFKIKKLDPRLPSSIIRWEYNKSAGRLIGPVQVDTDGEEYQLPIEKIMIFTNEREGDNWEGISILRPAYKPWYIKGKLEKINAIKHDRHGVGVYKAKLPSNVVRDSDEWNQTRDALESLYANDVSYLMEPDGYQFESLQVGNDKAGTDALPSIQYCDRMIARGPLVMFVDLGTTETGSRALGGSFIDLFLDSLQAQGDYICEVMTRFLIHDYCRFNYNIPVEEYPRMRVSSIKKLDSETIAVLSKAGVITNDNSLENAVRDEMGLPEKDKEGEPEESEGYPFVGF